MLPSFYKSYLILEHAVARSTVQQFCDAVTICDPCTNLCSQLKCFAVSVSPPRVKRGWWEAEVKAVLSTLQ